MPSIHATAYLKDSAAHFAGPVNVLFGAEHHLKRQAFELLQKEILGDDDDEEISLTQFSGKDVEFITVADELRTVSMWGDTRLVVVDDADEFVTKNRPGLEDYLKSPAKNSVLILLVKKWPKTTKLAKAVAKTGTAVECTELKGQALVRWVADTCQELHRKQISRDAAALVVEMAGADLGLLSQELSKLTSYVGEKDRISPDDVRAVVGSWTTQNTFVMIESLIAGRLDHSLTLLDDLLRSGESPYRILGAINYSFRKLAAATESARQGTRLGTALADAGIFRDRVGESERYLRWVGRQNAENIYNDLLKADSDLKGGSRVSKRVSLEQLLVRLSGRASVRA